MTDIRWVEVSKDYIEGYEGEELVAKLTHVGGPWHWTVTVKDDCPWQVSNGEEYIVQAAKREVEDCRSDQIARSGRGRMMRWQNPSKDAWYGFSGDRNIASIVRYGSRGKFFLSGYLFHRSHEFVNAADARRHVEHNWVDFLENMNLVPKPQWKNPPTVPVMMVPVVGRGVLVIRRGIPPHVGKLAFPGGFHEEGETWQEAAAREVLEETGIAISNVRIVDMETVDDGRRNLAFAECDPVVIPEDHVFPQNGEVQGVFILNEPVELCFSTHTAQMKAFFERHPELRG